MLSSGPSEPKLSHLNPQYLVDVKESCATKLLPSQYDYIVGRIESSVDVIINSMINAHDHGYSFLKLAIHPGSTQESMSAVYERVINQTPWKYKRTVLAFVEAVDTIFKFSSKSEILIEKFQLDNQITDSNSEFLGAVSQLTVNYIVKLIEQEKTYMAS